MKKYKILFVIVIIAFSCSKNINWEERNIKISYNKKRDDYSIQKYDLDKKQVLYDYEVDYLIDLIENKNIAYLYINSDFLGYKGLKKYTILKNIYSIDFDSLNISSDDLNELLSLFVTKNVKIITITNMAINQQTIEYISKYTRIEDIAFYLLPEDKNVISDHDISKMLTLPNCRSVTIHDSNLSDLSLQYFSRMPKLQFLSLENANIKGSGLRYFDNYELPLEIRLKGNVLDFEKLKNYEFNKLIQVSCEDDACGITEDQQNYLYKNNNLVVTEVP